ncbi:hypothetical protein FA13DRAFT_518771 [Coprinellus micaceus]|uniref:Uncharacterized protein n=1 Tax=Coprinellus micaceus TaxID=71717 RepID=A0A4Y7SR61_COPMI|nr:hypothetical protein FA13DRAFT_1328760 [Coprinellus micaceus]TEB30521.1 hypothetical protein FA13DRAFT_518771 [Coprinellus micaceus]
MAPSVAILTTSCSISRSTMDGDTIGSQGRANHPPQARFNMKSSLSSHEPSRRPNPGIFLLQRCVHLEALRIMSPYFPPGLVLPVISMLDREIQPRPSAAAPLATAVIFALLCSVLGLLGHGCCPLHLIQPCLLEGQEETRRFAGTETSKWVSKLLAFACGLEKCEPTCSQRFQDWSTTAKLLAFLDESSIISV